MKQTYLGIDIGGTNCKFGVRENGQLTIKQPFPTPKTLIEVMILIEEWKRVLTDRDAIAIKGVGVVMPGNFNYKTGGLVESKRFGVKNFPIAKKIREIFQGVPVAVLNDGQAAGLGELFFGAGQERENFVFLSLGTSVGGCFVINDHILVSRSGKAIGRVAHMIIDPNGPECRCGNKGCWETFVSAARITQLAKIKFGQNLTPQEICEKAERKDKEAKAIFQEIARYLAYGIANLANILSPETIILGGGILNAKRFILPTLRKELKGKTREGVSVICSQLGDEASLWGATVLAEYQEKIYHGKY